MQLRMYLTKNRITITEFCENIGYSRNQISGIINGRNSPSKRLAAIIVKATNGEVTIEELMKEPEKKEMPKLPSKTIPKGWVMEKSVFDK